MALFESSARIEAKNDSFATLVTLLGHPVVIGTLGLFTVIFTTIDNPREQLIYLLLLIFLTFAPAALYLFVHFKGNLMEMLELIEREARLIPYLLMILGAIGAILVLTALSAPRPIFVMTLVLLANEIILGTLNFWTKVSIHTATITFTAMTLGYLVNPAWYSLIFLVPLVAWARVYRKRHTLKQVIGGTVFAAIITVIVIVLSNYFVV